MARNSVFIDARNLAKELAKDDFGPVEIAQQLNEAFEATFYAVGQKVMMQAEPDYLSPFVVFSA